MPEEPTPAIALPMIKAVEVGAAPQTTLPISKIAMEVKNTHLMFQYV